MTTEKPAFAPRGTFQDDSPSTEPGPERPFVNAPRVSPDPYRDTVAALHARRRALIEELEEIERALAPELRAPTAPTPADRVLSEPDWLGALSRARWARPLLGGLATLALVVLAAQQFVTYATRPAVLVHDDASVVEVGGARFVVARTLLDRLASGRFRSTTLSPVVEKGVVVGLRIEAPERDEASALGLYDGDVVIAVDDHEIARPDGARRAFETLRLSPEFDVLVRRGDAIRRLHYVVVG